jgi:hypothetical protein
MAASRWVGVVRVQQKRRTCSGLVLTESCKVDSVHFWASMVARQHTKEEGDDGRSRPPRRSRREWRH